MASLADTHVIGVSFPRPLPMDEDVDIFFFDHDPLNLELERDGGKRFEVHVDLPSQFVQLIHWQQHGMEPGPILSFIGTPQGFQRLIDTEQSLMLGRVSNGLRRAPNDRHGEHDEPHDSCWL
jgi:hypothetical protein